MILRWPFNSRKKRRTDTGVRFKSDVGVRANFQRRPYRRRGNNVLAIDVRRGRASIRP
jgi:hypothetical protein